MLVLSMREVCDTNGEPSTETTDFIPENLRGLERFKAREVVLADLEKLGLLEKTEDHTLSQPFGDRGGVPIEPMLTDQCVCTCQDFR